MGRSFKSEKIIRLFIDEAAENLNVLSADLVEVERGEADEDRLNRVARMVHTLKGSSAMLEFHRISALCHQIEDVLQRVRKTYPSFRRGDVEAIFARVDAIERMMANVEKSGEEGEVNSDFPSASGEEPSGDEEKPKPEKEEKAKLRIVKSHRLHLFELLGERFCSALEFYSRQARDLESRLMGEGPKFSDRAALESLEESAGVLKKSLVCFSSPDLNQAVIQLEETLSNWRAGRVAKPREAFAAAADRASLLAAGLEHFLTGRGRPPDFSRLSAPLESFFQSAQDDRAHMAPQDAEALFDRLSIPPAFKQEFSLFEKLRLVGECVEGKSVIWLKRDFDLEKKAELAQTADLFRPLMEWGEPVSAAFVPDVKEGRVQFWLSLSHDPDLDDPLSKHSWLGEMPGFESGSALIQGRREAAEKREAQEIRPADDGAPAEAKEQPTAQAAALKSAKNTIRVEADKLDVIVNLVAELVVGHTKLGKEVRQLKSAAARLNELHASMRGAAKKWTVAEEGIDVNRAMGLAESSPSAPSSPETGFKAAPAVAAGKGLPKLREALSRFASIEMEKTEALASFTTEISTLKATFDQLFQEFQGDELMFGRIIEELQGETMKLRMLTVSNVFNKFPRRVRDIARSLGKKIEIDIQGEDTELDKSLIEEIEEPLLHLIRNAIDHGIEPPGQRVEAGKDETGRITLKAGHEGNSVIVEVTDDGRGVDLDKVRATALKRKLRTPEQLAQATDREIQDLIFEPGFSTAEQVSDLSGRGVGMDAVRAAILRLKGSVELRSEPGLGSAFRLKLPLTLAIIQAMIVRSGGRRFVAPMDFIDNILSVPNSDIHRVDGREALKYEDRMIPLLRLDSVFSLPDANPTAVLRPALAVRYGDKSLALMVDEVVEKQQIVIKNLGGFLGEVRHVVGATIFGDGSVAVIVDVPSIVTDLSDLARRSSAAAKAGIVGGAAFHRDGGPRPGARDAEDGGDRGNGPGNR